MPELVIAGRVYPGAVALCAAPDTMRSFFRSRWKVILAIVLLIVLALVTVNPRAAPHETSLALRLQAHTAALEAAGLHGDPSARRREAADYIAGVLRMAGYRVEYAAPADGGGIEATVGNGAPGAGTPRTFVVGARIDPARLGGNADGDEADGARSRDDAADAASVLELARLLKGSMPRQGDAIRFVFFLDAAAPPAARPAASRRGRFVTPVPDEPGSGSFIAFVGTLDASRGVRDALAVFQGTTQAAVRGLAAPAYLQGVTLSDGAAYGSGGAGPALMITDTAFASYPYRQVGAPADDACARTVDARRDYDGMARVVAGIARTIAALAAGQRG